MYFTTPCRISQVTAIGNIPTVLCSKKIPRPCVAAVSALGGGVVCRLEEPGRLACREQHRRLAGDDHTFESGVRRGQHHRLGADALIQGEEQHVAFLLIDHDRGSGDARVHLELAFSPLMQQRDDVGSHAHLDREQQVPVAQIRIVADHPLMPTNGDVPHALRGGRVTGTVIHRALPPGVSQQSS